MSDARAERLLVLGFAGFRNYLSTLEEDGPDVLRGRCGLEYLSGNLLKCLESCGRFFETYGDDSRVLNIAGNCAYLLGWKEEASEFYGNAILAEPFDPRAVYNSALMEGDSKSAETFFKDRLRADPLDTEALEGLSFYMLKKERFGEALRKMSVITDERKSASASIIEGNAHYGLKKYLEAKESFRAAFDRDPFDVRSWTGYSVSSGMARNISTPPNITILPKKSARRKRRDDGRDFGGGISIKVL